MGGPENDLRTDRPRSPVTAWTSVLLAAIALACIPMILSFLSKAPTLPTPWIRSVQIAVTALLIVVLSAAVLAIVLRHRLTTTSLEWIVLALFVLLAVLPGVAKTAGRRIAGSERMVLDCVVQVEAAAEMLTHGKNPYAEDYFGTELERWHRGVPRPPLYHFVYPPLPVLLTVPLQTISQGLFGLYDGRFLLLPVLVGTFVLCWKAWRGNPWRAALLAAAFLNPWYLSNFHVGRWDTLSFLFWALALQSAARNRLNLMAWMLALAALTKTTCLPAALFGLVYAWRSPRSGLRWAASYAAPFILVFVPFLIWDPKAILGDMFGSVSGWGPHPFPISDFGFAGVLQSLGWASGFPLWAVQIPLTAAVAASSIRHWVKDRSLLSMGMGYALTTATGLYFGRLCDPAYLGALLTMTVLAVGFDAAIRSNPTGCTSAHLRPQESL